MKKVYIICPVRLANDEIRTKLEGYAEMLEAKGHVVFLPHRDNEHQVGSDGMEICLSNGQAMEEADEIHLFYDDLSQGIHFDLGFCFALQKPLVIVENGPVQPDSFPQMLERWAEMNW